MCVKSTTWTRPKSASVSELPSVVLSAMPLEVLSSTAIVVSASVVASAVDDDPELELLDDDAPALPLSWPHPRPETIARARRR